MTRTSIDVPSVVDAHEADQENAVVRSQIGKLVALFIIFLKAGTFTFAGGLAMLPLIEKDVVVTYRLLPRDEFMEFATLSQTLPGVIAINCAAFVGRRTAGTLGMLAGGLGAALPALVFMLIATILLQIVPKEGPVIGAFRGIRAASAALVLAAAFSLGQHNIKNAFAVIVMLAALVLVLFANVSAPLVVLAAGIAGYVYQRIMARRPRSKTP